MRTELSVPRGPHRSLSTLSLPPPDQVILLKEGTDTSQGKAQLISNINACMAVVDTVATTLGPRGMDKLIHNDKVCGVGRERDTDRLTYLKRREEEDAGHGALTLLLNSLRELRQMRCALANLRSPALPLTQGQVTISNDGATIMKLLDIVHPAAKSLCDVSLAQDAEVRTCACPETIHAVTHCPEHVR